MTIKQNHIEPEIIRQKKEPFIVTIKEHCRVCYTCVRECPVKAIRITGGQAEVLPGHCIGCGNCVKICRQNAKHYETAIYKVKALLSNQFKVAAMLAPSYVAEFYEYDYQILIGMLRMLGFEFVNEVAFGADLIAKETMRIVEENPDRQFIESSCPAVMEYVKCYQPELLKNLAPIVSPMIATARILTKIHGNELKKVFIGPCIAKKFEASSYEVFGEVDEVLTFKEIKQMFREMNITPENVVPSDFDPPFAGKGALYPVTHGMHQSTNRFEDLVDGVIVTAAGRDSFIDALKSFESGELDANLLELLCCKGCIMGPGMDVEDSPFRRRARVSKHVRQIMKTRDPNIWYREMHRFEDVDFTRDFIPNDQRTQDPDESSITDVLKRMGKTNPQDELNCGACGYETCREHAIAIIKGLAEDEMCLPFTIERLHNTVKVLGDTYEQLAGTREALIQSEKLASMGQLSAGIAHELNNPLGAVMIYANIILDELDENSPLRDDLQIITTEANRCKGIVSGLLNFARENKVVLQNANICDVINQCVKITKTLDNIKILVENEVENPFAVIDRDQIIQVLNNLINNSVTALPDGGIIRLKANGDINNVNIIVSDNGIGIPQQNLQKIFEPFFTTKHIGKGTGLGLAVCYGIIKMHRGSIKVESNSDSKKGPTGTSFTISLPRKPEEIMQ